MTPPWANVAVEFKFDGSMRDIYVFNTTVEDWQVVLDSIMQSALTVLYYREGELTPLPERAIDAFPKDGRADRRLSVVTEGTTLNCHFFNSSEIEFDLDPREVTGQTRLDTLMAFMHRLSDACGKPAVMTVENFREAIIFRVNPNDPDVDYFPVMRGFL